MGRNVGIQLSGPSGPWLSESRLDPGVRTESQGLLRNRHDPVHLSCLGSRLVLGLRMDLSLQLGHEGTGAQPWGKEDLGASLRTLSCGVEGKNAETPGRRPVARPG